MRYAWSLLLAGTGCFVVVFFSLYGKMLFLIVTWRFFSHSSGEGQSFQQQKLLGLWVIIGFLTFLALEKIFLEKEEEGCPGVVSEQPEGKVCCSVWIVSQTCEHCTEHLICSIWQTQQMILELQVTCQWIFLLLFRHWVLEVVFISGLWFCGF